MADESTSSPHLQINFCVGSDLLAITPVFFDLEPEREDSGVIYCHVTFNASICRGAFDDVFIPESFQRLLASLVRMRNGEPATVSFAGMEVGLSIEWDSEERVAVFKASVSTLLSPTDRGLWGGRPYYRTNMGASVELEAWMEADLLEGPIAGLTAVQHIQEVRDAYRAQGHTFDPELRRWT